MEFSEPQEDEDLLIPITPIKNIIRMDNEPEEEQITVRKNQQIYNTPGADSRASERGLKRLASEAFRFVVNNQKRTSYK